MRRRLDTNAIGDTWVDDACIDCGTCQWMVPEVFDETGGQARVHTQPRDADAELGVVRAAVSCPTASIHAPSYLKHLQPGFPVEMLPGVYHCGYHHRDSFGATSWLVVRREGNVLVDSPRFTVALMRQLDKLGGVSRIVLTHRDDVADHRKFAQHYGCPRTLHQDDVQESTSDVEHQPTGTAAVPLADDLLFIPTPGHTKGSACLLYRPAHLDPVLFSGDHLAWSLADEQLHAFRDFCWHDWGAQRRSMERLAEHAFGSVLPGHGAPAFLQPERMGRELAALIRRM